MLMPKRGRPMPCLLRLPNLVQADKAWGIYRQLVPDPQQAQRQNRLSRHSSSRASRLVGGGPAPQGQLPSDICRMLPLTGRQQDQQQNQQNQQQRPWKKFLV